MVINSVSDSNLKCITPNREIHLIITITTVSPIAYNRAGVNVVLKT